MENPDHFLTGESEDKETDSRFEVGMSVLGNDFLRFDVTSASDVKNWAFFGVVSMIAIMLTLSFVGPSLVELFKSI